MRLLRFCLIALQFVNDQDFIAAMLSVKRRPFHSKKKIDYLPTFIWTTWQPILKVCWLTLFKLYGCHKS